MRSASSAADRARLWQGRKKAFGAMGRIAPDLAVQDAVVPRSALPDIMDRIAEIRDRHRLSISNVFHAGDGNLHPNISFDRRDPDVARRVHVACTEIMAACVDAGGSITGEHGVGSDKLDYMPWIFDAETLGAMRAVRRVFDPDRARQSGQGRPVSRLPRMAGGAGGAMSDVVHGRLRALLGTSGVERDPAGLPRAIPDTADALSLVCRLAHEERWKIRVEGQGTWLSADAPADLAVSTRGLDQVVSVSPADLVATVQAGTPLEALRRRLADEGMWLALDPPGRPERSLGSVVATATAGPLRHGFGPVRDHVLGCTVATGDGRLVKAGGRVVKNVAGYDLTKLQVGGFGGFGIIAEVHLRLRALPRADVTLMARGTRDTLTSAARDVMAAELVPAALELLSPALAARGRLGARGAVPRHRRRRAGRRAAVRADRRPRLAAAAARSHGGVLGSGRPRQSRRSDDDPARRPGRRGGRDHRPAGARPRRGTCSPPARAPA